MLKILCFLFITSNLFSQNNFQLKKIYKNKSLFIFENYQKVNQNISLDDSLFLIDTGKNIVYVLSEKYFSISGVFFPDSIVTIEKEQIILLELDKKMKIVNGYYYITGYYEPPFTCVLYNINSKSINKKIKKIKKLSDIKFNLCDNSSYCGFEKQIRLYQLNFDFIFKI
ncbi:MAG: hypothetical protein KA734_12560 [Fluviicola sp.]|nr:hypothetical protein [Fluviicola sp.]MBP6271923.1 hypothetical protein [Fluviicola sp.]